MRLLAIPFHMAPSALRPARPCYQNPKLAARSKLSAMPIIFVFPKFCTLALSPLFKAIVLDLHTRAGLVPVTDEDLRLAEILIDQCHLGPRDQSYPPSARDTLLRPILSCWCDSPGDGWPLTVWAERLHTTERPLSRRRHNVGGVSFEE